MELMTTARHPFARSTENVYVEEVKQTNIINILGLALILGSNNNEAKKTVAGEVFEVETLSNGSH